VTDSVIPSKLLTYMASGRTIIASVNAASETARRINDASCGVVVTPEDPRALVEGAMALHALGANADSMEDGAANMWRPISTKRPFYNNTIGFLKRSFKRRCRADGAEPAQRHW